MKPVFTPDQIEVLAGVFGELMEEVDRPPPLGRACITPGLLRKDEQTQLLAVWLRVQGELAVRW